MSLKEESEDILYDARSDYVGEAIRIVEAEMNNKEADLPQKLTSAIESVAAFVPEIEEDRVKKYVNGDSFLYYFDDEWQMNINELSNLCDACKAAQFDVSLNVVGILLELYGVPQKVAIKATKTLVANMPAAAKIKLATIAELYFSNPFHLVQISKGLKMLSELIIYVFGDIGTVLQIALSEYDRRDVIIISANVALNVSLLFATGGTALAVQLTLKSKTLYDLNRCVMHMKKVCGGQRKLLLKYKGATIDLDSFPKT